jgi:hypothetical protein
MDLATFLITAGLAVCLATEQRGMTHLISLLPGAIALLLIIHVHKQEFKVASYSLLEPSWQPIDLVFLLQQG